MNSSENPTVQQLFDLKGQVALVTGGAGYLGTAISSALAEAGATVVVSSRDIQRAEAAASQLPKSEGASHFGVQIDHKNEDSIRDGVAELLGRTERLDILFNNGQGGVGQDWTNINEAEFRDQLANAAGYFLLSRVVRDHAVERSRAASIILLGSMYGMVGSYPDAYSGVCPASSVGYHALKGGIIHMARHLAVYWAGDRVRVNCLSPGPFPGEQAPQEMVARLCTKSPMARMGLPYELKGAAVFLASDASSYVTGQNIVVDGGWTAW
jgi:NAD(P)-dependent dehydrogenase (short-subunit alcohol dehydrogenase family)